MKLQNITQSQLEILTISEFIFDDTYDDLVKLKLINLEHLNIQKGWTFAYFSTEEQVTLFSNLAVPSSKNQSFLYFNEKEDARSAMSKLRELTVALRQAKTYGKPIVL